MPKKKKPEVVTVRERKLGREQAYGLYFPGKKVIELDPRMDNKQMLHVAIHEALHHCFPFLTEESVTENAPKIGEIVWAVGYRRITK